MFMLSLSLLNGFSTVKTGEAAGTVRGVVAHRISGCDYFVVQTRNGYDLLEWYGDYEPDKGDVLIGAYESYGFHDVYDETVDQNSRVYTEDYWLSKSRALEELAEHCE